MRLSNIISERELSELDLAAPMQPGTAAPGAAPGTGAPTAQDPQTQAKLAAQQVVQMQQRKKQIQDSIRQKQQEIQQLQKELATLK